MDGDGVKGDGRPLERGPDEEGIETAPGRRPQGDSSARGLERGPDEEGIETRSIPTVQRAAELERGPDEEGIETADVAQPILKALERGPDEEGIETWDNATQCSTLGYR